MSSKSKNYTEEQNNFIFEKAVEHNNALQLAHLNDQFYFERRAYLILLSAIGFGFYGLLELWKVSFELIEKGSTLDLIFIFLLLFIATIIVIIGHELAKETRASKVYHFSEPRDSELSLSYKKRAWKYMKIESKLKIAAYTLLLIAYISLISMYSGISIIEWIIEMLAFI